MGRDSLKMRKKLILHKPCFINVVFSCGEVYKLETYGDVFGKKLPLNRGWNALYAYPRQTTKKTIISVSNYEGKYQNRIESMCKNMGLKRIGDYHSHTFYGKELGKCTLSGDDILDLEDGDFDFSILTSVNPSKSRRSVWNWDENKIKGRIKISIDQYLKLNLKAFYFDYKEKKPKILEIELSEDLANYLNKINKRTRRFYSFLRAKASQRRK